LVVIVPGAVAFVGIDDFRREVMRSFTVSATLLSVLCLRLERGFLFTRRGRGSGVRFAELALEAVVGDCREGWTVLCGFEYWGVNRFFGIRRLTGGW
jgi:hypothetical protein